MADRLAAVFGSYIRVARSRSYFPLWLSQLVSNFGDTLHYIALVVLVYEMTGRGTAVALLVVAEIIPVLILGPVAGVVIDRFDRKTVLIGSDLFRAALAFSLIWSQSEWHAYAVAAGLAAGNVFFNPTVHTVIPAITTEEQRLAANSVAWSTGRLVQIVAAAVAGGLIARIGTDAAFAVNAATFAVSALLIGRLVIPAHAGLAAEGSKRGLCNYFADARAGLTFALRDRLVSRLLILFIYGLNTSTGMVVFNSTLQGAIPDAARGRVFTLLDVTWSANRLLSLARGAVLVDLVGVRALFWSGGSLLAVAGLLGLSLLGGYDFRGGNPRESH